MPKTERPTLKAALRAASRVDGEDRFDRAAAGMVASRERTGLLHLPLDAVRPNPGQPRQSFDAAALEDLAESIRQIGVLQPILVRPRDDGAFDLVAGERRYRAARLAGLETIPATLRPLTDRELLEASLTENLQREDLTPMEEARVFARMIAELGYSVRRLAERLGKGKGVIEDRLRLLRMEPELQAMVSERPDTLTHAREIEKVDDAALRADLARQVQAEETSLKDLRERIRSIAPPPPNILPEPKPTIQNLKSKIQNGVSGRPDTQTFAIEPKADPAEDAARLEAFAEVRRRLVSLPLPDSSEGRLRLCGELKAIQDAVNALTRRLADDPRVAGILKSKL